MAARTTVRLARGAQQDVKDGVAWYEGQQAGLGAERLCAVRRRSSPMRHFFTVGHSAVRAIAIVYLARHPGTWQRRP